MAGPGTEWGWWTLLVRSGVHPTLALALAVRPPAPSLSAAQSLPPATGDGASGMPAHLEVSVVPVVMHHKT